MKFDEFFNSVKETAMYDKGGSVIYPALGLAGETGEAVDIVKKSVRYNGVNGFSLIDGKTGKDRTQSMKLELGDVLWYWSNLCIDLGFDPSEIMRMNYDKLHDRYKESI
jgi:NTP pyrophosphatase (non-canonical NTP hydrolase)